MPYKPLSLSTLKPNTGFQRPYFSTPNLVTVAASALEVMTDLRYTPAAIIDKTLDIESASQKMIARGVRTLLVIDEQEAVIGIITARDLIGTAVDAMLDAGRPESDIQVSEVMTPGENIEVIPLDEVLHAHVGNVIETLKSSGRQHALVVEQDSVTSEFSIRGIFSASQIARQLGIPLIGQELTQTFEQIDRVIKHQNANQGHAS